MRTLIMLPCAALLTAATPATSSPPAVASEVAPSETGQGVSLSGGGEAQRVEEKKICKQLDTTGSRLPRRACLTQKEWKQLEEELDH